MPKSLHCPTRFPKPSVSAIVPGLFSPRVSGDKLKLVVALICKASGPYNLFHHSCGAAEDWEGMGDWADVKTIALGFHATAYAIVGIGGFCNFQREGALGNHSVGTNGERTSVANRRSKLLSTASNQFGVPSPKRWELAFGWAVVVLVGLSEHQHGFR